MELHDDVMDTETARRLVLRTIERRPDDGYTPTLLSRTLGMPLAQVRLVLEELLRGGLILEIDGEYVSALQLG